jgi:cytochrome c oxidase cbb3-type subunit III
MRCAFMRQGIVGLILVACFLLSNVFPPTLAFGQQSQAAQNIPGSRPANADPEEGKRQFEQNCSTCHGVDAGGEVGPDLHGVAAKLGASAVHDIIRRGIPGTAMPGSSTMSERQVADVVTYLRGLEGTAAPRSVAGDPSKGKALYQSSGCPTCHMIDGQGGDLGPELTRIGAMRGAPSLKARLLDPGADLPKVGEGVFGSRWTQYLIFRAVQKNGHVIEGMRVGEDSFSIVLKDSSGAFHGLWKPDLRSLEKEPGKSFMPSFQNTLSEAQLEDLVAYLMTLKGAQ